jgi:hypothetical protein
MSTERSRRQGRGTISDDSRMVEIDAEDIDTITLRPILPKVKQLINGVKSMF